MFHRYKLQKRKKELNNRTTKSKIPKSEPIKLKSEKERILSMFKNSSLLLNAFNRLITNNALLDANIEEFTVYVFSNLMKCRKEKVISKNIDCIKKILQSSEFHKVKNVSYDYFKSLFYMERFPKRLFKLFSIKYKEDLLADNTFLENFQNKYNIIMEKFN